MVEPLQETGPDLAVSTQIGRNAVTKSLYRIYLDYRSAVAQVCQKTTPVSARPVSAASASEFQTRACRARSLRRLPNIDPWSTTGPGAFWKAVAVLLAPESSICLVLHCSRCLPKGVCRMLAGTRGFCPLIQSQPGRRSLRFDPQHENRTRVVPGIGLQVLPQARCATKAFVHPDHLCLSSLRLVPRSAPDFRTKLAHVRFAAAAPPPGARRRSATQE